MSIVAQGALVFDVRRGVTAILNDDGDEVGTSELRRPGVRRLCQHATFVLREHDATTVSLTVHPAERKSDARWFRRGFLWHPVTGPLGESVGFIRGSSAFSVDGQRVLKNESWGTRGGNWRRPLHRNGVQVAALTRRSNAGSKEQRAQSIPERAGSHHDRTVAAGRRDASPRHRRSPRHVPEGQA